MITAKNYAAQAERALLFEANNMFYQGNPDAGYVGQAAIDIASGVHFALPDGGRIFDDKLKGLVNHQLNLPYPLMTLEYFRKTEKETLKIVLILRERDKSELTDAQKNSDLMDAIADSNKIIEMRILIYLSSGWMFVPMGLLVPSAWDSLKFDKAMIFDVDGTPTEKGWPLRAFPVVFLHEKYKALCDQLTEDKVHESFSNLTSAAFRNVLEFCEALTCSNVKSEPIEKIDKKKNEKRVKSGKLPIYETRVLVIEASNDVHYSNSSHIGHHRSPRQHLRRGHIRRLEKKNIWVNSCVVGNINDGLIEKSYRVVN